MMENQVADRRRTTTKHSAEDQALDQIAKEVCNKKIFFSLLYFTFFFVAGLKIFVH